MDTPVREGVVKSFKDFKIKVSKGRIARLADLGNLKTIWATLGNTQSSGLFKVQEVMNVLDKDDHIDNVKTKCVIEHYMKKIQEYNLELVITLDLIPEMGYRCIDGNKRATAYYEYNKSKGLTNIDFPVYVLRIQS